MKNFSTEEILLLFAIGCVIGYIAETGFSLLTQGKIGCRKGVVYGPFNQVYGFGAVLLTLLLYPLSEKSPAALFAASALIGGIFEALCSLVQEKCFGTVSWEYSKSRVSLLGGRTSLKYMFFWGVMGSLYIKFIHPALFSLIGLIPDSIRTPIVFCLTAFLVYDMVLSAVAVKRWQLRSTCAATSPLDQWLDERFPDKRMERIYPEMIAVDKQSSAESSHNRPAEIP